MATKTAMNTFADRSAELTLLFWGGTTATGTLLGQVSAFNWATALDSRENYRIGDSTKYRNYTSEDVTWGLTLYEDADIEEIAKVMGSTKPTAGGWVGTESIDLDVTNSTVSLTLANYDGETTAATLLWVETLTSAMVDSITRNVSANEVNSWEFSGVATEVTLTPEAALGA